MSETTTGPEASARLDPALLRLGGVVVTGTSTALLDMTMVAVALAGLSRAFGAPVTTIQWVSTGYLLAIAVSTPVTGRLAVRYGVRAMWMCALSVFLAGSMLCGLAWSAPSLIVFRVLQGVGGGMIVPLGMMILARAAPSGQRGRAMALSAVPGQVAPIVGPLIGGVILDGLGWRWIFYVNVPIGLLALVLAWRGIPREEPAGPSDGQRLDLVGLVLLSPALALTMYGLSARPARLDVLAAGLVLLAAFTAYALRTRGVPLLNLRVFAHRPFAAAAALGFLSRLSIFGVVVLVPLYYQQVRGHSALVAGLLVAPQSLGTMLALPHVGRLTDRIGGRPVVLSGIAVTVLGALAFTQVDAGTSGVFLGVVLLAWGIGLAAVVVPVWAMAFEGLPPGDIPDASSTITAVTTVGASAGAAILVAILQSRLAHHPGVPAAAFADTSWWALGFTALALVPALLLPARHRGTSR